MAEEKYAILSENSDMVLGEAILMERRGSTMTMKLLDDVKFLNGLELIKFHKMQSYAEIYQGKITEIKGNLLSLSEVVNISAKMRNEIKIKIRIDTKLIQLFPEEEEKIPISIPITTNDISCGGIGFVSKADLDKENKYEVVIHVTSDAIVVDLDIVRKEFQPEQNQYVYGSKFSDLNIVEERMLREAIFRLQMRRHHKRIMEEKNR